MPHGPARWPSYSRPETSQVLKVENCKLHVRMKMRLGGCATCSENADANTGVGVVRCLRGRLITRGTACLTYVCVYKAI
jgi:hypothetical protein